MADLPVTFKTLGDFGDVPPAIEDAGTFAGNAAIKAAYYARHTGCWTLADDSGLEVDALGGAPGVLSARYAGPDARDAQNNAKLVHALRDIPPERRKARFRCAVALSDGHTIRATAEGFIEGLIIDEPRGDNGFGYDPHFWVPQYQMTTAEMSPERKNAVSHRAQALATIRPRIESLLSNIPPT